MAEVSSLLQHSISDNTQAVYRRGYDLFCQHIKKVKKSGPDTSEQVVNFIATLSLQGFSPSTIYSYVAGVGYYNKIEGWEDPTDNFLVKKLLHGKKRRDGQPDHRLPLTLNLLVKVIAQLPVFCHSQYETLLYQTSYLTAFYFFLRISEYGFDPKYPFKCIKLKHIQIIKTDHQSGIKLYIPYSKTDQLGKGQTMFVYSVKGQGPCPVSSMQRYLETRPPTSQSCPLFIHFDKSPLTRYEVNRTLGKGLELSGLTLHGKWGSHSIRIGAATWFYSQNYPLDRIKIMGRWAANSNVVLRYIRL